MPVYFIGNIQCSDELYHHGIKGQKWGVRRYQNPDGSLTAAGRQRYLEGDGARGKMMSRIGKAYQKLDERDAYEKRWSGKGSDYLTPMDLAEKGDDWKTFRAKAEQMEKKLEESRNNLNKAAKKRQRNEFNPFGRKKRENEYKGAREKYYKKYEEVTNEFMGESLATIDSMPKQDREAYESYVFWLLGYDW